MRIPSDTLVGLVNFGREGHSVVGIHEVPAPCLASVVRHDDLGEPTPCYVQVCLVHLTSARRISQVKPHKVQGL